MRSSWVSFITVIPSTLALPASQHLASVRNRLLLRDSDDDFYPDDLSFVKRLAAVGDSYSAGIGAGDRLGGIGTGAWDCSRYDHSYPNILNSDYRLGDSKNRQFEFHSCSGAVVNDVLNDQLPRISGDQDVILLSAGGNDAELVDILNQCIFQWAAFDINQVPEDKKLELRSQDWAKAQDIDWDKLGRGCGQQLKRSNELIESSEFASRLDSLIEATKKKLASGGTIYYTGYAKFFGTDLDPACDKVSWTMWIADIFGGVKHATLASENRKMMNNLVDLMNQKLEEAVERGGSQVEFVNYDEYVGRFHGRYCEPGVDESTSESNTRPGLMFYEMNTLDPFGSSPWKRSTEAGPNGTFEGDQDLFAQITKFLDPDAVLTQEHRIEDDPESDIVLAHASASVIEKILPNGIGRVFHPQILLHEIIASLVLYRITVRRERKNGWPKVPEVWDDLISCPVKPGDQAVLHYKKTPPGKQVKKDTKLRILPVGDSITVGFPGVSAGGDGDGYRRRLRDDLSEDRVVFAGTETSGTMDDGYYAAWSGMTIQYIADHIDASLEQRPNIVLVAAGTNDMNANHDISTEGNDPAEAASRLGKLVDKIVKKCPDATVLVAMIINTCDPAQSPRTKEFQQLIPAIVKKRKDAGDHVLAVDFTTFDTEKLRDCIHPTNDGYKIMGDYWYDFITQIPSKWIENPVGKDLSGKVDDKENGGIDKDIPDPDWGTSPIQLTSREEVVETIDWAIGDGTQAKCNSSPLWKRTGTIALGNVGKTGDWKYHKDWYEAGKVADGLGWGNANVRLHDMNGDGKADYVWIHPQTGEIRCWLNNLPEPWSPAGNNDSIIGSGVGPAKTIYIADMNGDGMEDYLVVDPSNGSVRIWWNYGPDDSWVNGWKFVAGGEIASGVPHANLATLRFPDINGDGRADYVYIGEGGALKHHLNIGSVGGQDVLFHAQGGIATGAVDDISKLVFADMNGDGRDDYLIWDSDGGLTGYLNQRTNREGVPLYINQGPAKTIADGIGEKPSDIRLADMDGDGKDDYVFIGDNGALYVWYNLGTTDDSMAIDGLRFANTKGSAGDDYVWLDPKTGAPILYLNIAGAVWDDRGWGWFPVNEASPVASGAAPARQVQFGDIDGDGYDDYLTLGPETGELKAYLWVQGGGGEQKYGNVKYDPIGTIATGLGPGKNVRIADIDGDGRDDYIYLNKTGGAIVYRNIYGPRTGPKDRYRALPEADAFGIGQRPEEISFHDVNGDGKADYIWTRPLDGRMEVWLNMYPELPAWHNIGVVAEGVGTSGANVRVAQLTRSGRPDYIAVDPNTGALAAWLNGCDDKDTSTRENQVNIGHTYGTTDGFWAAWGEDDLGCDDIPDGLEKDGGEWDERFDNFPSYIRPFKMHGTECFYVGSKAALGHLYCDGITGIRCRLHDKFKETKKCGKKKLLKSVYYSATCEW